MSRYRGAWVLAFGVVIQLVLPQAAWPKAAVKTVPDLPRTLGLENESAFFKNLGENLALWVFEDPAKATKVLRRYKQSRAKYHRFLVRALHGRNRERQLDALTLIGLLRLPEFTEASVALARREPGDHGLQEAVAFYLHRVGRDPAKNLERLLARFPSSDERVTDSDFIFWLGFVDSPEPARSLLRKLGSRVDGSVAVEVHIALEWLSLRCPESLTPPSCEKDPWL